jgi:hypothetical protein
MQHPGRSLVSRPFRPVKPLPREAARKQQDEE